MPSRFRFSGFPGRGAHDPWFRIGTLEVGTTMLVTLLSVASMVVWAFSPPLIATLALFPDDVRRGWVWQLVTWPLANPASFWGALTIFFFWYFGSQLEGELGRGRMARFLVALTIGLSVLAVLLSAPFGFAEPNLVEGLSFLQLFVLLVWIAGHLHAQFFFGIPAWVLGAVLVAIPVLQMLAYGRWLSLLHLLLGLVLAAVVARSFGLLSDVAFVPKLGAPSPRPSSRPSRPSRRSRRAPGGQASVVGGPWAGSSSPANTDQAKLDALLDKIHEGGMDSLSAKEREQLLVLRRRLRGE